MELQIQTSRGTNIPNSQENCEKSLLYQKQLSDLKIKFLGAIFKSGPSPIYNCHGLTFASRRTGIYSNDTINLILNEDAYIEVKREEIMPGDIVIYLSSDGDFEHSGIIIDGGDKEILVPLLISKWGSSYETIHSLYNCPYALTNIKFFRCSL